MTATMESCCPACGGRQLEAVDTANPHNQLFGCGTCGHVFAPLAALKSEENRQVQLDNFGEAFAARKGLFVSLYERINARRTARALGRVRGLRVLEIGPGSGAVMAWLAHLGHDVQGLDMSHAVARQIERRWGLPVTTEPLAKHVRAEGVGTYDVIIMRHVLEHFTDPYQALINAHALLNPKGRLYVAVPNMASWHRHFRGWSGYESYHIHFFDRQSIAFVLSRAGFRVASVASYESLTGWVNTFLNSIMGQEMCEGRVKYSKGGWKRQVFEIVRLAIGALLSPIRWFQSSLGRGEELTVMAEKVSA